MDNHKVLFRSVGIFVYTLLMVAAHLYNQVEVEAKQTRDDVDRQMADHSVRPSDTIMQQTILIKALLEIAAQKNRGIETNGQLTKAIQKILLDTTRSFSLREGQEHQRSLQELKELAEMQRNELLKKRKNDSLKYTTDIDGLNQGIERYSFNAKDTSRSMEELKSTLKESLFILREGMNNQFLLSDVSLFSDWQYRIDKFQQLSVEINQRPRPLNMREIKDQLNDLDYQFTRRLVTGEVTKTKDVEMQPVEDPLFSYPIYPIPLRPSVITFPPQPKKKSVQPSHYTRRA